ncbi:MAG: hypothetical protein WAO56_12670 [Miniphocaeibacter sp.]|uniref:hypothetical protein n=1 Tax=Miniphocaeibacter sp. TaxID=3100973 RepID=UPI003BAE8E7D
MNREKKTINKVILTFFSTLILILILILIFRGNTTQDIKRNNTKLNIENFSETIKSYINLDESAFDLSIYSFDESVSEVSTYALAYATKNENIKLNAKSNIDNYNLISYYETILYKKNYIDLSKFDEKYSERDFAMAYYALNNINDKENIVRLKNIYLDLIGDIQTYNETEEYKKINSLLLKKEESQENLESSIESLSKYVKNEITTLKDIFDLHASVLYLDLTGYFNNKNNMEKDMSEVVDLFIVKFKNDLENTSNQRFILSENEIIVGIYSDIISIINSKSNLQNINCIFWEELLKNDKVIFEPIQHSLESPRNFAYFLIALSYTDIELNNNQINNLHLIFEDLMNNKNNTTNTNKVYFKQIADILKIDINIDAKDNEAVNENTYFLEKDPVVNLLIEYSISEKELSKEDLELIKSIILEDYITHSDFLIICNLYFEIANDNRIIEKRNSEFIKRYINNHTNLYGFTTSSGNYDLETSVIYLNIFNILDKEGDGYKLR